MRILFWEVTRRCNLACLHCRANSPLDKKSNELSLRDGQRLIEHLASFTTPPLLIFSGGEPLCHKHIFDLLFYASKRGLKTALATNGTLLTQQSAARIKQAGVQRVSISLDGANPGSHDRFRGITGSFDQALAGFNLLKAVGVSVQINTTLSRHNLGELADILNLCLELQAEALHLFMLVPVGCGLQIKAEEMLTPIEYEQTLNWIYLESKRVNIQIKPTCAPHYMRIVLQQRQGQTQESAPPGNYGAMTRGCLAGSEVCFVSSEGNVYPCGYLPLLAGNILQTQLREIWQNSTLFQELQDANLLKGKCGCCEYKWVCGGCRARAFGQTNDYLAEEPYCAYLPLQENR